MQPLHFFGVRIELLTMLAGENENRKSVGPDSTLIFCEHVLHQFFQRSELLT
jgi:hypothetical protein